MGGGRRVRGHNLRHPGGLLPGLRAPASAGPGPRAGRGPRPGGPALRGGCATPSPRLQERGRASQRRPQDRARGGSSATVLRPRGPGGPYRPPFTLRRHRYAGRSFENPGSGDPFPGVARRRGQISGRNPRPPGPTSHLAGRHLALRSCRESGVHFPDQQKQRQRRSNEKYLFANIIYSGIPRLYILIALLNKYISINVLTLLLTVV